MTSSNGNILRITVPLCGDPPVTGEFRSQRESNMDLLRFLCCQSKQIVEQILNWAVIWDAMTVIWWRCNVGCTVYGSVKETISMG